MTKDVNEDRGSIQSKSRGERRGFDSDVSEFSSVWFQGFCQTTTSVQIPASPSVTSSVRPVSYDYLELFQIHPRTHGRGRECT
jgi:hypothetical protein